MTDLMFRYVLFGFFVCTYILTPSRAFVFLWDIFVFSFILAASYIPLPDADEPKRQEGIHTNLLHTQNERENICFACSGVFYTCDCIFKSCLNFLPLDRKK